MNVFVPIRTWLEKPKIKEEFYKFVEKTRIHKSSKEKDEKEEEMAFIPRLSEYSPSDMHTSPLYNAGYGQNIFSDNGYGLPNCTAYCFGRRYEITGKYPTTGIVYSPQGWVDHLLNGGEWYGNTADGCKRGQEPKLGATICFTDGDLGHVASVEEIIYNTDGTVNFIRTSNSAWTPYGGTYFYTDILYASNNYNFGNYYCQGFIYIDDKPEPVEIPKLKKSKWIYYLKQL